jgi:hypothetical protein
LVIFFTNVNVDLVAKGGDAAALAQGRAEDDRPPEWRGAPGRGSAGAQALVVP